MKTILNVIWSLMLAGIIYSCAKDEDKELFPTNRDTNWWEIKDEPGELNQLRYAIYKEYGIRIFINDTLGIEQRGYNVYGEPILHVEKLIPGYRVDGSSVTKFCLSNDTASLIKTIEILKEQVFKHAQKEQMPFSFLICDTVYEYRDHVIWGKEQMHHYSSTLISSYGMTSRSEDEQKYFGYKILGYSIYNDLGKTCKEALDSFYVATPAGMIGKKYSFKETFPDNTIDQMHKNSFIEYYYMGRATKDYDAQQGKVEILYPLRIDDCIQYIAQVMTYSPETFNEKWKKYPLILKKYQRMREVIKLYAPHLLAKSIQ